MELFKKIKQKLTDRDYANVVSVMGYDERHRASAINRLERLLQTADTKAWFSESSYDLHYSNEEFLTKLCDTFGISSDEYRSIIDEVKTRLRDLAKIQEPNLYVKTDFQKRGVSLSTLGYRSREKKIPLEKEKYLFMPEDEFIEIISQMIRAHYHAHEGKLPFWGEIVGYYLIDRDGSVRDFDTQGVEISETKK